MSRLATLVLAAALVPQPLRPAPADQVVIRKARREMQLLRKGVVIRTYRVALGPNPVGQKVQEGDGRTPEGDFIIDGRLLQSQFHRALHISYPRPSDRARAAKLGVSPGGDIMIHGLPPAAARIGAAHRLYDWTAGCIAVTNEEIEEIWRLVPNGTRVRIDP